MLKFYDCSTAPSPRRARIFLHEKQADFETVEVDLRSGEQLSDAFKAINPRCTVPVLVTEDGYSLTENLAIASYLEDIYPEPNLMGRTPLEKALILEWNWRIEFEGLSAIAEMFRNSSKAMANRAMTGPHNIAQIPELAQRGATRLSYFFEDLNTALEKRPFVAGETLSLADITAYVTVDFSAWVKQSPSDNMSSIHKWHTRLSENPNFKV